MYKKIIKLFIEFYKWNTTEERKKRNNISIDKHIKKYGMYPISRL